MGNIIYSCAKARKVGKIQIRALIAHYRQKFAFHGLTVVDLKNPSYTNGLKFYVSNLGAEVFLRGAEVSFKWDRSVFC